MSKTLEEAIANAEAQAIRDEKEAERKRKYGGKFYDDEVKACLICAEQHRQLAEWLKELAERRKADNEIPFGNAPFSELDSIINAYEMHGNHKKVVELLKELSERRKLPEIIRCGECAHSNKEYSGEMWCGICNGFGIDENSFCSFAERRTDSDGRD